MSSISCFLEATAVKSFSCLFWYLTRMSNHVPIFLPQLYLLISVTGYLVETDSVFETPAQPSTLLILHLLDEGLLQKKVLKIPPKIVFQVLTSFRKLRPLNQGKFWQLISYFFNDNLIYTFSFFLELLWFNWFNSSLIFSSIFHPLVIHLVFQSSALFSFHFFQRFIYF